MNVRETFESVRDTVCVPQRGNTCDGYGGILCDNRCLAYEAGLARRKVTHEQYLRRRISEHRLPSGITVRVYRSNQQDGIVIETGEYLYDGNDVPIFTCFTKKALSEEMFQAIGLVRAGE